MSAVWGAARDLEMHEGKPEEDRRKKGFKTEMPPKGRRVG